jgi:hypothetical protein
MYRSLPNPALSLEYTFGMCGCSSEAFIWLDLLSKIKLSAIYEQVCGGSTADKKIDSKVWTNYFSELYKYSNSTESLSHVETT